MQHRRHTNVTTPSIHGFAGTNVSPYEKMASPERALHIPYERWRRRSVNDLWKLLDDELFIFAGNPVKHHRQHEHSSANDVLDGNIDTHQVHPAGQRHHHQRTNDRTDDRTHPASC